MYTSGPRRQCSPIVIRLLVSPAQRKARSPTFVPGSDRDPLSVSERDVRCDRRVGAEREPPARLGVRVAVVVEEPHDLEVRHGVEQRAAARVSASQSYLDCPCPADRQVLQTLFAAVRTTIPLLITVGRKSPSSSVGGSPTLQTRGTDFEVTDTKVMIIGLDCAEPSLVLERWRDELPTLSRLADQGSWGRLTSIIPPITVPAWSCMMASRTPGDLGVYGFRNRSDHSYDGLFIANGAAIKEPRLWDLVTRAGKRVDRARRARDVSAAPAERRAGQLLPDAVDRELSTRTRRCCGGRSRASSASTSSTARTSAPKTRTTSCARSTT